MLFTLCKGTIFFFKIKRYLCICITFQFFIMNTLLFFSQSHILIIVLIVLLLFGGKKIPELMKGLGKGVKSFKEGMNDVETEIKKDITDDKPTT